MANEIYLYGGIIILIAVMGIWIYLAKHKSVEEVK
jgi:hypothetical protein